MPTGGRLPFVMQSIRGFERQDYPSRERAYELARGDMIVHWDDDDWYAPRSLSVQAESLLDGSADLTGLTCSHFLDLDGNTSPKQTGGLWWSPRPVQELRELIGADFAAAACCEPERGAACGLGFSQA